MQHPWQCNAIPVSVQLKPPWMSSTNETNKQFSCWERATHTHFFQNIPNAHLSLEHTHPQLICQVPFVVPRCSAGVFGGWASWAVFYLDFRERSGWTFASQPSPVYVNRPVLHLPSPAFVRGGEENRAVNNNSNLECGFVSFWHTTMEISVGFKIWKCLVNESG